MPAGRPTKYDPKYCDDVINFMIDGYSVGAFAGYIGVSRSTVYLWADQHPDFSDALKAGQASAAYWWEKQLRNVAMTGDGNASAAIFGVKNRSGEDYKDKQELDHTTKGESLNMPKFVMNEQTNSDKPD